MSYDPFDTVCATLKASCRHFVIPGETRNIGQARLVFAFWNYEESKIESGAGAAWIGRQWARCPEPTVLLGFESEEHVRRHRSGSVLTLNGIVYLELPARAAVIQSAIDGVRLSRPGVLDVASQQRNADDWGQALSGWRHTVNNLRSAILAGQTRLGSEQSDETRRQEYKVLAGMGADIVNRSSENFKRICAGTGVSANAEIYRQTEEIMTALAAAARIWDEVKEMTNAAFNDESADRLQGRLRILGFKFDFIQTTVQALSGHISKASTGVSADRGT